MTSEQAVKLPAERKEEQGGYESDTSSKRSQPKTSSSTDLTNTNPDAPSKSHSQNNAAAAVNADAVAPAQAPTPNGSGDNDQPKLSKNQLRKLKRKAHWEEGREDRKRKRKEKRHDKRARRRDEKAAAIAEAEASGLDPSTLAIFQRPEPKGPATRVPVSLIIDCDFEKYMTEGEQVSLSSQVTRCYADNRRAKYQTHLYVSSFQGKMKERYETTLKNSHVHWKGAKLLEGDYVEVARDAAKAMSGSKGNEIVDALKTPEDGRPAQVLDGADATPQPEPEGEPTEELKNIIYLSAESSYTLDRLEPNTCYVIGGIVDRNREKGLCHRRARERGVRTAKLPIGQYLEMASRRVLATNHVVEIMLKWLETGDWGKAFMAVMPKRKGGKLRGTSETAESSGADVGGADAADSRLEEEDDEDMDEMQTLTEGINGASAPVEEQADEGAEEADVPAHS